MTPPTPLENNGPFENDALLFAEDIRNIEISTMNALQLKNLQQWIRQRDNEEQTGEQLK